MAPEQAEEITKNLTRCSDAVEKILSRKIPREQKMKLINLYKAYNTMSKILIPALCFNFSKYRGGIAFALEGDFSKYVNLRGRRKKQAMALIDVANLFSGNISEIEIVVSQDNLPEAFQRIYALLGDRLSRNSRRIENKQDGFVLYPGQREFLSPIMVSPVKPKYNEYNVQGIQARRCL